MRAAHVARPQIGLQAVDRVIGDPDGFGGDPIRLVAAASDDPAVRARLGSAGMLVPGIEAEIRDEFGDPVTPADQGVVRVVSSPSPFSQVTAGIASFVLGAGWRLTDP